MGPADPADFSIDMLLSKKPHAMRLFHGNETLALSQAGARDFIIYLSHAAFPGPRGELFGCQLPQRVPGMKLRGIRPFTTEVPEG